MRGTGGYRSSPRDASGGVNRTPSMQLDPNPGCGTDAAGRFSSRGERLMGERRNTGRRAGYASAVVVVAAQAALALPACFSSSSGSPGANDAMTPDAMSEDAPASPGEDATAVSTPPDAGDATPVDAGADGGEGGPDAGDAAGPSCPSDLGDAAPT